MAHPHNSGLTLRIFLKFCTMKGANMFMDIILMGFPKKSCLVKMGHFRPKMARPHKSGSAVRIVLQCCTMKESKRDMEIILMVFLGKKIIWGNLVILAQKWFILITSDPLQFFWKFYTKKGAKRYMKILLVVFREKISFGAIWSF